MKVIRVDNFAREGPGAVEEKVVAGPGLPADEAERIAEALNEKRSWAEFHRVVEDGYVLQPPWEP